MGSKRRGKKRRSYDEAERIRNGIHRPRSSDQSHDTLLLPNIIGLPEQVSLKCFILLTSGRRLCPDRPCICFYVLYANSSEDMFWHLQRILSPRCV
jgi:hypothetical protein